MKNIELTKTILLVEDEAIISIITTKAVKKAGYNVITANSGEKAVEMVSGGEISDYEDTYHSVTAEKSTPVKLTIAPIKNNNNWILGGIIIAEDKTA